MELWFPTSTSRNWATGVEVLARHLPCTKVLLVSGAAMMPSWLPCSDPLEQTGQRLKHTLEDAQLRQEMSVCHFIFFINCIFFSIKGQNGCVNRIMQTTARKHRQWFSQYNWTETPKRVRQKLKSKVCPMTIGQHYKKMTKKKDERNKNRIHSAAPF